MRAIWKFKLEPGETVIKLPQTLARHHFLHAGIDATDGNPAVWVLVHTVDPDSHSAQTIGEESVEYKILTLPTGEIVGEEAERVDRYRYLGTVHQHVVKHSYEDVFEDDYVWHVFVQPGYYKVGHDN